MKQGENMRLIALDTETTGLSAKKGHRMVEIAAVEIDDAGNAIHTFHHYINPGRHIPAEVVRIHGIDNDTVADKPLFSAIAQDFLDFVQDATLIIHNAPFDLSFIEYELALCGKESIQGLSIVDTLKLARSKFKGQKNNLDALCHRYGVDCTHRQLHGALLDAQLLAEVYTLMGER